MKLHEKDILFRQAVIATAEYFSIPEIFIEKDYWVTFALKRIFQNDIGEETIFKGGTSLSKCFRLIDRFSEDIDLVVKHTKTETDNQLKKKIKNVGLAVSSVMPELIVEGLTRKLGMNRKTVHSYPKLFDGSFGHVRDVIVVEATWFGHYEPFISHPLSSYICEMMVARNQQQMLDDFDLHPFDVNVLLPARTFCEKIMSLVRFSYGNYPIEDLKMKIRHIYDLYKMLENKDLKAFSGSENFDAMLCRVAQDDMHSFRNNNEWLINHPANSLLFSNPESVWLQLRSTYTGEFSGLVHGELPESEEILSMLIRLKNRLEKVKWQMALPE